MKKLAISAIAAVLSAVVLIGCKTTPSTEVLYATSYSIGVSAALVLDQTKLDDNARNTIIDIVGKIDESVPQTNVTFYAAWMNIAATHVEKLIESGKIDKSQGTIIMTAFSAAVQTLDYIVYKRFPTVGQNVEYVEAVTHGFCGGLLTYFKPVNSMSAAPDVVYDAEAYKLMQSITNKTLIIK